MADLIWWPQRGYGYLPPDVKFEYKNDYIDKYREYEEKAATIKLNNIRRELVDTHIHNDLLIDFGCGAGTFLKGRPNTMGYDLVPEVVAWLKDKRLYNDPYLTVSRNVSFWDSFEHIVNPKGILNKISHYVFISTPIYENVEGVLKSKHYKPNEHLWYFTSEGLIKYLDDSEFECLFHDDLEYVIGREGIGSFVFKRK
jgi:hypothetical protein